MPATKHILKLFGPGGSGGGGVLERGFTVNNTTLPDPDDSTAHRQIYGNCQILQVTAVSKVAMTLDYVAELYKSSVLFLTITIPAGSKDQVILYGVPDFLFNPMVAADQDLLSCKTTASDGTINPFGVVNINVVCMQTPAIPSPPSPSSNLPTM